MRSIALALCAVLATGCASSGGGTATPDAADASSSDATVDMIVINRTTGAVTAFAQWQNGPRVPLGEVGARATRRFSTPRRSTDVLLSLNVLSAPSVGTVAGAPTLSAGGGGAGGRTRDAAIPFVSVVDGDVLEWEIHSTYPAVDLTQRRLPRP